MKILVMDTVRPGISACAIHRIELIKNLTKLNQEVHVITNNDINLEGVFIHPISTHKNQNIFTRFFYRYNYIRHLIKLIKTYQYDILYTRNSIMGIIGLFLKKIGRSKLVFELNGISIDEYGSVKGKINIKTRIYDYLEIFSSEKVDSIICVTQGIKDILINRGVSENKIRVISNGANINLFKPISEFKTLNKLKKELGINKTSHVILFVGHMVPWHGAEYLIRSAPTILREVPNTFFLIVGDKLDSYILNYEENKDLCDRLIFTGIVSYETVPHYINISDVCVAPYVKKRNEKIGLSPLKIYEYLACGKPVVASNIKGIGDILDNSYSGISVEPENPGKLANAIIKLLKSKQLRSQMGNNGRKLVVMNYSWEKTARETIEVFEELLKS